MGGEGRVAVVGGGLTGLSAAYELSARGIQSVVLEAESRAGGLASSFEVAGGALDRFYHHWFRSDEAALALADELGLTDDITWSPTRTSLFYNSSPFRLSTPLDVLRFTPLSLLDRVRLGLLVLQARMVRDWRRLEPFTAREWIVRTSGQRVYEVVWEPLLQGKFGSYASEVGAVWFWKKIALRGGSRSRAGREELGYLRGGFQRLADQAALRVEQAGGEVRLGMQVTSIRREDGRFVVQSSGGPVECDAVVLAVPLPIAADLTTTLIDGDTVERLRKVRHLANICLVLELNRSLSSTYWMNVSDPAFPFVGVIEHTNFQPTKEYGGRHIAYLSRYLSTDDPMWGMDDGAALDFTIPYLARMFPAFSRDWIVDAHVWRAKHAQPVVPTDYSNVRPPYRTSIPGLYMATMAHIYPEDRGTNYAIRDGRMVGGIVVEDLRAREA